MTDPERQPKTEYPSHRSPKPHGVSV